MNDQALCHLPAPKPLAKLQSSFRLQAIVRILTHCLAQDMREHTLSERPEQHSKGANQVKGRINEPHSSDAMELYDSNEDANDGL